MASVEIKSHLKSDRILKVIEYSNEIKKLLL